MCSTSAPQRHPRSKQVAENGNPGPLLQTLNQSKHVSDSLETSTGPLVPEGLPGDASAVSLRKPDRGDVDRIVQDRACIGLPPTSLSVFDGFMPLDHYVTLGRSGLRVSPFALGAMTFGEDPGGAGCSVEESEKILATYLDLGGNFVDTANFYSNGHTERILGDWFAAHPGRRDRVVLASKFFGNLLPGDPNGGGAGRKSIIPARRDPAPHADRLPRPVLAAQLGPAHPARGDVAHPRRPRPGRQGPLHRLLQHPRLGHRTGPDHGAAEGWTPLVALQVEYSLLARTVEGELAPLAHDQGLALVAWSPSRTASYRASTAATPRSPTPPAPPSSALPARTSTR